MKTLIIIAVIILIGTPCIAFIKKKMSPKGAKSLMYSSMSMFFLCVIGAAVAAMTQNAAAADTVAETASSGPTGIALGLGYLAASFTTIGSCIGSGIAVASAASAALGAISENEKIFGKALIMVSLAEAISLYGLLISILIINTL